jgi:hypothetical protein
MDGSRLDSTQRMHMRAVLHAAMLAWVAAPRGRCNALACRRQLRGESSAYANGASVDDGQVGDSTGTNQCLDGAESIVQPTEALDMVYGARGAAAPAPAPEEAMRVQDMVSLSREDMVQATAPRNTTPDGMAHKDEHLQAGPAVRLGVRMCAAKGREMLGTDVQARSLAGGSSALA